MVNYVPQRSYPQLERRRGGGIAGTGWNGLVALAGMLALFALSVPFWLFPPLWPILPLVILGWVNQRLLRYDALAEHADADEAARIFRARRGALYLLGLLLALLAYVPLAGFFAPVLFGLAFIHYLLGALAAQRSGA
jgi:CysZ protein